eukprot:m51a1_g5687 hypothetical protein (139) ;mRNA; f:988826-989396
MDAAHKRFYSTGVVPASTLSPASAPLQRGASATVLRTVKPRPQQPAIPYDELTKVVRAATVRTGFNFYVIATPSAQVEFKGEGTVVSGHKMLSKALMEVGMAPEDAAVADAVSEGDGVVLFTAMPLNKALMALEHRAR